MDKRKIKPGDYLLFVLNSRSKSPIKGRTKLQYTMFVSEKEVFQNRRLNKVKSIFEFEPYNYGPFSKKLIELIEAFYDLGLISIKEIKTDILNDDEIRDNQIFIDNLLQSDNFKRIDNLHKYDTVLYMYPIYSITKKGEDYLKERNIIKKIGTKQEMKIEHIKHFFMSNSLKISMKYIFIKYPNFTKSPKIRDKILRETEWKFK